MNEITLAAFSIIWFVTTPFACAYFLINPICDGMVDGIWKRPLNHEQFTGVREKLYWWAYEKQNGSPDGVAYFASLGIIVIPLIVAASFVISENV